MHTHTARTAAIQAGIIGATGYAGIELASLLFQHPSFELVAIGSTSGAGETLGSYYPQLPASLGALTLTSLEEFNNVPLDVAFLAVPHTTAFELVASLLERGVRVVDLSADYRLLNPFDYETYYNVAHPHPELLKRAIYGLSEYAHETIAHAALVANPGCYPTASALACLPAITSDLIETSRPVTISAVSGYSGAGKKACETHDYGATPNIAAYKPLTHQHTPEIEQTLSVGAGQSVTVNFVPQIASFKRGIYANCFLSVKEGVTAKHIDEAFAQAYKDAPFVHARAGVLPEISEVVGTNNAALSWKFSPRTSTLYVAAAIDNLIKGAAGQALQNANIMFNIPETTGLTTRNEVI